MSIKSIEKDDNQLNNEYFSYFNYKLYEGSLFSSKEKDLIKSEINNQSTEESLSTDLYQSINNLNIEDKFIPLNLLDFSPIKEHIPTDDKKSPIKDIKPELHIFILPKSLFNSGNTKNKKCKDENISKVFDCTNNNNDNISNNNSLNEKPFINHLDLLSQPFVPKNKVFPSLLINSNDYLFNVKVEKSKNKKEERKKKKNVFVKRDGDWICSKCKNLNFAFRSLCNKCKLPKKESESQIFDIGKELMKLADLSICNKSK